LLTGSNSSFLETFKQELADRWRQILCAPDIIMKLDVILVLFLFLLLFYCGRDSFVLLLLCLSTCYTHYFFGSENLLYSLFVFVYIVSIQTKTIYIVVRSNLNNNNCDFIQVNR